VVDRRRWRVGKIRFSTKIPGMDNTERMAAGEREKVGRMFWSLVAREAVSTIHGWKEEVWMLSTLTDGGRGTNWSSIIMNYYYHLRDEWRCRGAASLATRLRGDPQRNERTVLAIQPKVWSKGGRGQSETEMGGDSKMVCSGCWSLDKGDGVGLRDIRDVCTLRRIKPLPCGGESAPHGREE